MRWLRRWLNRNKPFTCLRCGFEVPIIGTRRDQAALAIDHLEDKHPEWWLS